jgi:hypothetical protein
VVPCIQRVSYFKDGVLKELGVFGTSRFKESYQFGITAVAEPATSCGTPGNAMSKAGGGTTG